MCSSVPEMSSRGLRGVTLVELVVVMVISSIVVLTAPLLFFYGVKTLVFLPKALAVNNAASEAAHQMLEGGFSTLQAAPVAGMRFASRNIPAGAGTTSPAIWLAEADRIGFQTSDGQRVLIRWDGELIKRSLPPGAACPPAAPVSEEALPYQAQGIVRITTAGSLFQYYNQSGALIAAPGCASAAAVRRVDITFAAQTGNGVFDQGNAKEDIKSSVAIRVP